MSKSSVRSDAKLRIKISSGRTDLKIISTFKANPPALMANADLMDLLTK